MAKSLKHLPTLRTLRTEAASIGLSAHKQGSQWISCQYRQHFAATVETPMHYGYNQASEREVLAVLLGYGQEEE